MPPLYKICEDNEELNAYYRTCIAVSQDVIDNIVRDRYTILNKITMLYKDAPEVVFGGLALALLAMGGKLAYNKLSQKTPSPPDPRLEAIHKLRTQHEKTFPAIQSRINTVKERMQILRKMNPAVFQDIIDLSSFRDGEALQNQYNYCLGLYDTLTWQLEEEDGLSMEDISLRIESYERLVDRLAGHVHHSSYETSTVFTELIKRGQIAEDDQEIEFGESEPTVHRPQ